MHTVTQLHAALPELANNIRRSRLLEKAAVIATGPRAARTLVVTSAVECGEDYHFVQVCDCEPRTFNNASTTAYVTGPPATFADQIASAEHDLVFISIATAGLIALILLIVGAGGGFKQTLVDSGVGQVIGSGIANSGMPLLLAGWLVAAVIRVATGSATVATITAAGIMAPLATGIGSTHLALMVLAIGAGSVFLSHVNDAGFWLVKEYFGMTVTQTFKTWSVMECAVSLVGLVGVLLLGLVV